MDRASDVKFVVLEMLILVGVFYNWDVEVLLATTRGYSTA